MAVVDPRSLFKQLQGDLPADLHEHVFVVGSLAAAYHFQKKLVKGGVNTKDADLVIHPAGDIVSCAKMAERLLDLRWRRKEDCYPSALNVPPEQRRAIRLLPPSTDDYFVEFLNLPAKGQKGPKEWVGVEVKGGGYGLPTFRFQGLTAEGRLRSEAGLEYATPAMMALANLLSHPEVRDDQMSAPIGGRMIRRSSKDLGRVLALTVLAGLEEVELWVDPWRVGIQSWFPAEWKELAARVGDGLRRLLVMPEALDEARHSCEYSLLAGLGHTTASLTTAGERILGAAIEPLAREARS